MHVVCVVRIDALLANPHRLQAIARRDGSLAVGRSNTDVESDKASPPAAWVRTSAGRRPGAAGRRPIASDSAVGSPRRASSRKRSRASLCPRVEGPGAQQSACAPSTAPARPQTRQQAHDGLSAAPRRKRTASTYTSGSSVCLDVGANDHNQSWLTLSSHRSRTRRASCPRPSASAAAARSPAC